MATALPQLRPAFSTQPDILEWLAGCETSNILANWSPPIRFQPFALLGGGVNT
jgi:hypothetical protein